MGDCEPALFRSPDQEQLGLRAGQLARNVEPDHQRRRPMGVTGSVGTQQLPRVQDQRQLGSAPGRRVGRAEQRPQQALRELRPLFRINPNGHQHPIVWR